MSAGVEDAPQLIGMPSGRRLRHLRLLLAVGDGEQSVLDECDNRIRGLGFREGAGGKQRARVSFRRVWHIWHIGTYTAGSPAVPGSPGAGIATGRRQTGNCRRQAGVASAALPVTRDSIAGSCGRWLQGLRLTRMLLDSR
jgi:hypothetical protein